MRLPLLSLLIPPLFLIISCSSTAKKEDVPQSREQVFLQKYLLARKAPSAEACSDFAALSKENTFILKSLAQLRAHMSCTSEQLENLKVTPIPSDFTSQPHLKVLNEQRLIIEAERSKDPAKLAVAWRLKALASDRIRDKVEFLQKAIEFAKTANENAGKEIHTDLIEDIQSRIYSLAPRLKAEISPADYQKVGTDFAYNREFDKARLYFEKILFSKDAKTFNFEAKYQAYKSLRSTYKVEQNREKHIEICEQMTHWLLQKRATPKLLHESYVTWARSAWTNGDPANARKVLLAGKKNIFARDRHYSVDEFEFILGRMDEEIHDYASALEHYQLGEKLATNRGPTYDRMLFSKAWMLKNLNRFDEAASAFEALKKQTQDPFDVFRFQFWQAKSLKKAQKNEAAKEVFKALQKDDNLGYYGLLTYLELDEKLPPLQAQNVTDPSSVLVHPILEPETSAYISALIFTEESEILEKFLNNKVQILRTEGEQNPEVWLAYLKAYAKAGLFLPLFTQLGNLDAKLKLQLLVENPDLLFPKKYTEIIYPWAEKLKVRPELALSIIRQESAFNPFSRSPADAFGLMQVLPKVADEQQGQTGIKITHHDELFMPEKNIPVGIALLAHLDKRYRGQFILTAAAYNSSEKAIEGWLKTRLKEDPLEFIEDIPYEETKAYVKLVLRNFIFYTRLARPQESIDFPKWCLEDLQSFNLSTH